MLSSICVSAGCLGWIELTLQLPDQHTAFLQGGFNRPEPVEVNEALRFPILNFQSPSLPLFLPVCVQQKRFACFSQWEGTADNWRKASVGGALHYLS